MPVNGRHSTQHRWTTSDSRAELDRLLSPGLLGHYKTFEVINVVAFQDGQKDPLNVFCIAIAEERDDYLISGRFLNANRIRLRKLKDWSFGVMHYIKPLSELEPSVERLEQSGLWSASGADLQMNALSAQPPQFVPPDSMDPIALNRVLKNNFQNGSHIFEWTLKDKSGLQFLFDVPPLIQELSVAIRAHVTVDLASVSDRIGNLLIQLPVTVLMSRFTQAPSAPDLVVDVAWQARTAPRPLRASVELRSDGSILGHASANVSAGQHALPISGRRGLHRGLVWDEEHKVLLAATADSSFINTIVLKGQLVDPEPRVFCIRKDDGATAQQRVSVTSIGFRNRIGEPEDDENGGWTKLRMYRNELDKLKQQGRFFQYNPAAGEQVAMHERALQDIRTLVNQHGDEGACLWDPYLTARDILSTLFFCSHAQADLRALTNGDEPEYDKSKPSWCGRLRNTLLHLIGSKPPDSVERFIARQRSEFAAMGGNLRGLRLEYRIRRGRQAGPGFHDRFLIFPKSDRGALAFSLGHSINAVGKVHHILQHVDDGQLILDAFDAMWQRLNEPEHIVWKCP